MKNLKVISFGAIANIFEWYDYSLFGCFSYIIGSKFFGSSDPVSALLNAFMVFGMGYLMRPVGGIFFGIIGDKYGRKVSLALSVGLMSIPTAAIGLLPTYSEIGIWSSILIVLIRLLQGLSMGGALTGSISYLIEHTAPNKRGLVGSVTMSGICIGLLLASLASYLTREILGEVAFDEWGWRVPFLLGIVNIFVGASIMKYTDESPVFENMEHHEASPLSYAMKHHWFDMIMSIFINSTGSVLFYCQAVYIPNYLKTMRGFAPSFVDLISTISLAIMAITCLASGGISDAIGKRRTMLLVICTTLCTTFFISHYLQYGEQDAVVASYITLGILASLFLGPEPALQAEFYPDRVRSTSLSVAYNLSTSIFGGTTPLVIAYFYSATGSLDSFSYYLWLTGALGVTGLYFYKSRINNAL